MSLEVIQPGILSLLQDRGRFGAHRIGLTNRFSHPGSGIEGFLSCGFNG